MTNQGSPQESLHAVIMAGGIGSRFWPFSRNQKPKQFLDVMDTGHTLIQMTYKRLLAVVPPENIWVVSHKDYANLITEQLPSLSSNRILLEPFRKNTAACILWATRHIEAIDPNATVFIAPSDHLITLEHVFHQSIETACAYVNQHPEDLITFGIKASRPDTGYGYIRYDRQINHAGIHQVLQFVEKPNLSKAQEYLEAGDYVWNSGMFLWKNNTIDLNIKKWCPEIYSCFDNYRPGDDPYNVYQSCPSISIDYAVMEKTSNAKVLPVDLGWSDLGTWASLYSLLPKDSHQNVCLGPKIELRNSHHCLVHNGQAKIIAMQSVRDLIVINTEDALLICDRSQEQSIKEMVGHLGDRYGSETL